MDEVIVDVLKIIQSSDRLGTNHVAHRHKLLTTSVFL